MKKKIKGILVIALVFGLMLNANSALAVEGKTEGGDLGVTTVRYTIAIAGSANTYDQPYLRISTDHVVEELGIKDINIIRNDGGGITGVSRSATNSKGAVVYSDSTYGANSVISVSAHFYVNSKNFGIFNKNLAISR